MRRSDADRRSAWIRPSPSSTLPRPPLVRLRYLFPGSQDPLRHGCARLPLPRLEEVWLSEIRDYYRWREHRHTDPCLRLYHWAGGDSSARFRVTASMKVSPGLSPYSGESRGRGEVAGGAAGVWKEKVPRDRLGETGIRLLATVGLRLLGVGVVERILESCKKVLWSSGFQFEDVLATVISGGFLISQFLFNLVLG